MIRHSGEKMDIGSGREFVDYVKSIPPGKEAQLSTKSHRQMLQEGTR